jgi:hypothetical protein
VAEEQALQTLNSISKRRMVFKLIFHVFGMPMFLCIHSAFCYVLVHRHIPTIASIEKTMKHSATCDGSCHKHLNN